MARVKPGAPPCKRPVKVASARFLTVPQSYMPPDVVRQVPGWSGPTLTRLMEDTALSPSWRAEAFVTPQQTSIQKENEHGFS